MLLISDKCVNQIGQCTLACSRFESPLFQILVPINSNMTTQYHIKYHLGSDIDVSDSTHANWVFVNDPDIV